MTTTRFDPSAFQAQINTLGERMDKNFDELKQLLAGYELRLRLAETQSASELPLLKLQVRDALKKIEQHEIDINKALKTAEKLETIAKWVLGVFTTVLIAIIVLLATGKASIVFH